MPTQTLSAAGAVASKAVRDREPFKIGLIFSGDTVLLNGRPYKSDSGAGDVGDANNAMIDLLDEARRLVLDHGPDLRGVKHDLLLKACTSGRAACNLLMPREARERLAALEARELARQNALSLNIQTPGDLRPIWEMMFPDRPPMVEPADPIAVWKQFWGFRYPIGRTFELTEADFAQAIYPSSGLLGGAHDGLNLASQEVDEVGQQIQALGLDYQRVEAAVSPFGEMPLINFLTGDGFSYGLVHLACHCENPEAAGALQAELRLKAKETEVIVRLETLKAWEEQGFRNQPFIFLNACESQTLGHLLQASSFPIGFLKFKAGGVIATACIIPDTFAREFAVEFYRRLRQRAAASQRNLIAVALHETRLHFLETYHNPLGLAYGLYALADIRLEM